MSIVVHSSAIPVHCRGSLPIPVDSCAILWTPADSSGIGSFLQESVGHDEVLIKMPIKLEKKVENSITHCCHAKLKRLCSGSMSKYRNQLKTSLKIRKKYPQNKSDILCCHDIEVAVFIVQGPHLNIE